MTTTTDRIQDFLDQVAEHFSDLPGPERDDLLDDLRQHLVELADDDPDGLDLELVAPASYAAELRRSAGLPDPAGAAPARRSWLAVPDRIRDAAGRRLAAARRRPAVQEVQDFLPHLRPAWWVLRGWVLVVAASHFVSGGPWWLHVPVPDRSFIGLVVAAAAVAVSVRLGRDDRDHTRTWRAVDVSARVVLAVGLVQAVTTGVLVEYVSVSEAGEPWQPPVLRHPDGEPITNLYLFDEQGTRSRVSSSTTGWVGRWRSATSPRPASARSTPPTTGGPTGPR